MRPLIEGFCLGETVKISFVRAGTFSPPRSVHAALEHGLSQNVLVHMISGQLHEKEGKALTNFKRNLPPPDSDMAQQILRDPYNFSSKAQETARHRRLG